MHKETTSVDYLIQHLPKQRERYTWAPSLYSVELAQIDAIGELAKWVKDDGRQEQVLTDVLDKFAHAYGWSSQDSGPSTVDSPNAGRRGQDH